MSIVARGSDKTVTATTVTEQEPTETEAPQPEPAQSDAAPAQPAPSGMELVKWENGTLVLPTHIPGLMLEFPPNQDSLSREQMRILAPLRIEPSWDVGQVQMFLLNCVQRGFDPWSREAYLLLIDGQYVWHVGIDGLRNKAESTGQYRGLVGPQWCGPDGMWRDVWTDPVTPPAAARVGVQRAGFDGPVWGVAQYEEYAVIIDDYEWQDHPTEMKDGRPKRVKVPTGKRRPTRTWAPGRQGGRASSQLAKCAKAAGFRDAFPRQCAGFYVAEETERMRYAASEKLLDDQSEDEATARRRAAFDTAMEQAAQAGPVPVFVGLGLADDRARELLLAELDEQAAILGKTRREVTVNWVASEGAPPEEWGLRTLLRAVRVLRKYVLAKLREDGDDVTADRYMQAPDIGTVEELFGRMSSTIEGTSTDAVEPYPWEQNTTAAAEQEIWGNNL